MKEEPESLKSALVNFSCTLGMKVGDIAIEVGSLISPGLMGTG